MTESHATAPVRPSVTQLLELGRDREAAEIGTMLVVAPEAQSANSQGGDVDVLQQLDEVGSLLDRVVSGIAPEQLDDPTPCAEFTVRGVLEHMVGGATMFAAAFRGQEPPAADTSDLLAGFGPAMTNLFAAINEPGALDRTVAAPFGDLPGETFARIVALDGLVHGWDLATATGQPYNPSDALVADVDAFARGVLDPLRDGTTFGDATEPPAGATPIQRLVAFTGRSV